jgi:histidine triad (HIT) family protein
MASIFTKIINGEIPSYKVAETSEYLAFLDVYPIAKGHVLVIPKKEVDYFFNLDDATLAGLQVFAKKVARGLETVISCERIGQAIVGLEVPHAHIHLIPLQGALDIDFSRPKLSFTEDEFQSIAKDISNAITL